MIELLVVIAIIALLVGILLPALGKARAAGRLAVCLSGTRQMSVAMTVYANDNKSWMPLVPFYSALGRSNWYNSDPAQAFLDEQWSYGGLAGFFSLWQEPDETPGMRGFRQGATEEDAVYAGTDPQFRPGQKAVMRGYVDSPAFMSCPADVSDKYYGFQYTPNNAAAYGSAMNVRPGKMSKDRDIIHYNISYLYIAGFKTDESKLIKPAPLYGDETDGPDLSTRAWYYDTRDQPSGLNIKPGYYQSWDNHGTEGANFAFTDGHGELVKSNVQETFFAPYDPASPKPLSVNQIDRTRSRRLQTVD